MEVALHERGGMYGLSEQDLQIQARARQFADELIPLETEVELADGDISPELEAKHRARAIELGLFAAFFVVVANIIVDIAYAFVDPRVQYT